MFILYNMSERHHPSLSMGLDEIWDFALLCGRFLFLPERGKLQMLRFTSHLALLRCLTPLREDRGLLMLIHLIYNILYIKIKN